MTSAQHLGPSGPTRGDRLARTLALTTAVLFLVVGVLGFVPGVTTSYDDLSFAGHHSGAELLGIFQVSVLHNAVHLLFGLVGLVMARRGSSAVVYLVGGGLVYLVLFIYGVAIDRDSDANVVPVDSADNWLHLGLSVAMIALGVVAQRALRGPIGAQTPM